MVRHLQIWIQIQIHIHITISNMDIEIWIWTYSYFQSPTWLDVSRSGFRSSSRFTLKHENIHIDKWLWNYLYCFISTLLKISRDGFRKYGDWNMDIEIWIYKYAYLYMYLFSYPRCLNTPYVNPQDSKTSQVTVQVTLLSRFDSKMKFATWNFMYPKQNRVPEPFVKSIPLKTSLTVPRRFKRSPRGSKKSPRDPKTDPQDSKTS